MIRLVSMLAIEANDEWLVGRGYISQHSMAGLYDTRTETEPAARTTPIERRSASSSPLEPPTAHRREERQLLHHVLGLDSSAGLMRSGRILIAESGSS